MIIVAVLLILVLWNGILSTLSCYILLRIHLLTLKVLQVLVYAVLISDGNNYILFFLGVSMEGMSVGVLLIFLKIRTECIIWLWLHHKLMQLILRSICLIVFQIQLNHVVLNGQIEEQLWITMVAHVQQSIPKTVIYILLIFRKVTFIE